MAEFFDQPKEPVQASGDETAAQGGANPAAQPGKLSGGGKFQYGASPAKAKDSGVQLAGGGGAIYGGGVKAASQPFWVGLSGRDRDWLVGGSLVILGLFGWLFSINIGNLSKQFYKDASWSHGFVVPVLCGMMVYLQADKLRGLAIKKSWLGLGLLCYGILSHVLFRIMGHSHMSNLSMLIVLLGVVLFILGWNYLKILWLPIVYLLFMIPPPTTLYVKLTMPLQEIAAWLGATMLPLFGIEAFKNGTTLQVRAGQGPWSDLNVAEACSGIRMLVAFGALAVVLAYTSARPMWQKALLALCAAPVAILCNSFRVTLTGVLNVYAGAKYAEGGAHEMLGFLMLIPAALLQIGIGKLLDRIFVEVPEGPADSPQAEVRA